jgi:hypothetical protein
MTYYDPGKFPYIQNNFLTNEECDSIVRFTNDNIQLFENQAQDNGFWAKRVIDDHMIPDEKLRNRMISISHSVAFTISQLAEDKRPLVPDTLQIVRWLPGYELRPHADKEEPNGLPHPFPWRDFASVIYLNDDFEGGEIYWPLKEKEWKPVKGSLAIFPGTIEFLHGVRNVPTGVRYTLPSFYTYDVSKAIQSWRQ